MGRETQETKETLEPGIGEAKPLSPQGRGAMQSGRYIQAGSDTQSEVELPKVDGFDNSGVISDADVKGFLQGEFPSEHTSVEHLKGVHYTNEYVSENPGEYVAGMCETDRYKQESMIDINRQLPGGSNDGDKMKETISHEVGHNVYWNVLSDGERETWNKLSESSDNTEYVSDYAKTNEREDFAETYRAYMSDPELLKEVSDQKYAFMRNSVFDEREY